MKRQIIIAVMLAVAVGCWAQRISIDVAKGASEREQYAAEYLQKKLTAIGYNGKRIMLRCSNKGPAEGYTISCDKKAVRTGFQEFTIDGNDPSGVIYGAVELAERLSMANGFPTDSITEVPQMVMRGTCIGLQKTVYLPGHAVYEYPIYPRELPVVL